MTPTSSHLAARPLRALRLAAIVLAGVAAMLPVPLHAQAFDLMEATIAGVHEALDEGRLTCRGLVQGYLDRIDTDRLLGAFLDKLEASAVR